VGVGAILDLFRLSVLLSLATSLDCQPPPWHRDSRCSKHHTARSLERPSEHTLPSIVYWWSIPTGGEGHGYKARWPHAKCMKCFLRSSLYIIPQLSTSLYPSGGHGQTVLLTPTGRKLILLLLLLLLLKHQMTEVLSMHIHIRRFLSVGSLKTA
jgi:hypothetical protein